MTPTPLAVPTVPTTVAPHPAETHIPTAADLQPDLGDFLPLNVDTLLRGGSMGIEIAPPHRCDYPGETPVEGQGAVTRWLALHDCARQLRAALQPWDGVGTRQAQRAIRSLFLYEHQLTPKARRQARTA